MSVTPEDKVAVIDATEQGVGLLFDALRDGRMSPEDIEAAVVEVLAVTIDVFVPTGIVDPYDNGAIRVGVGAVYGVVADALERDPARMRARAAKVRSRGNDARADRIERRADRVEGRKVSS